MERFFLAKMAGKSFWGFAGDTTGVWPVLRESGEGVWERWICFENSCSLVPEVPLTFQLRPKAHPITLLTKTNFLILTRLVPLVSFIN
jgi:hypothetical protein